MGWVLALRTHVSFVCLLITIASFKLNGWDESVWLCSFFVFLSCSSSMLYNDWIDRDHDKRKGKYFTSEKEKYFFCYVVIFYLAQIAYCVYLFKINNFYGIIGLCMMILGVLYNYVRNFDLLSNLIVSLSFALTCLFAITNSYTLEGIVWMVFIFLTAYAREIIKDLIDMGIDKGYKRSMALRFGTKTTSISAAYILVWSMILLFFIGKIALAYSVPVFIYVIYLATKIVFFIHIF